MKVFFYSSQGYECLLSVARWYKVLDERKVIYLQKYHEEFWKLVEAVFNFAEN